jgi:HAD superfamily hydrolase (TIGR01662 family)
VIVTNQDASGWNLVPERQLDRIHEGMLASLRGEGVRISEVYYCPHRLLSDCACRKPRPGMLLAAARDLGVRPQTAWMVGDKPLDVQTGRAFGCRVAWVGPKSWRRRFAAEVRPWSPDVVADSLLGAASAIGRGSEEPVEDGFRRTRTSPSASPKSN